MAEPSSQPLTSQAISRLHKLGEGNGLASDSIVVFESEEKTYALEGTLRLTPKCEVQTGRHPGPPRGKDKDILSDVGELKKTVQERQKEFHEKKDWFDIAVKELKSAEGQGWGLNGAHITQPDWSKVYAAGGPCPNCQGQRMLICPQCHGQGGASCPHCQGRGQELCPGCGGTGETPGHPGQACGVCSGHRFIPCRHCSGRGQMPCPTCQGHRGVPCPPCQATGIVTEEVGVMCTVETNFILNAGEVPSGLRRGLDRLGIPNLSKGHADIEVLPPKNADSHGDAEEEKAPEILYRANLPYADIKLRFGGGRGVMISAFGKRALLLNVPPFLDDALAPARAQLKQAAQGNAALESALEKRAIRESLAILVSQREALKELRKIYPVGLSQEVMKEILDDLRLALNHYTRRLRFIVSATCVLLSTGLFSGLFLTSLHHDATESWPSSNVLSVDLGLLAISMVLSWFALSLTIRFALQRRFPKLKLSLRQQSGKTGSLMLGLIAVAYIAVLMLAPTKPLWLLSFFRLL